MQAEVKSVFAVLEVAGVPHVQTVTLRFWRLYFLNLSQDSVEV